jgi:hypothetical protein
MNVASAEELMREIKKRYDRKPEGWRILLARDSRGHYDLFVFQGPEAWQIKTEMISPHSSVGYGVRLGRTKEIVGRAVPHYGLRPVSERQLIEVMKGIEEGSSHRVFEEILKTKPVPSNRIGDAGVMTGPMMYSPKPLGFISEKQRELDLELSKSLDKLLYKKYPDRMRLYV